jgi:glyoxylase-like metal-dependent hydrolase (beta-lactamase superfamily II)
MFGVSRPELALHDGLFADRDVLTLGTERLVVRHTPGHSPGHIVLIHEDSEAPVAIVGDVLFAGGVGRTDLWGGSFEQLERSIREVLYTLPDHTRVIPGHGEETTIGMERESNPFVAD